jgi:hypothetical protein
LASSTPTNGKEGAQRSAELLSMLANVIGGPKFLPRALAML